MRPFSSGEMCCTILYISWVQMLQSSACTEKPLLGFFTMARRKGHSTLSSLCTSVQERTAPCKMRQALHFNFLAWYSAGKFFVPCDTWHNNGLKQIKTMNRSYLKGHIYKQGGCAKLGIFLNPSVHAICTSKSTMPPCYRQRLWFMYRSLKIAFTSWTPFYNCSSTQAQAEVNFHTISAVIKTICV